MFVFMLSNNKHGYELYPSTNCVAFPFPWQRALATTGYTHYYTRFCAFFNALEIS